MKENEMNDADFESIKVVAAIAPQASRWPKPDFSKVSLEGDKPHIPVGDLHWDALHAAVAEARERTLKALGSMAGIDANKSLSAAGKADQKRAVAEKAIAAIEKSKALTKAQAAVAQKLTEWNKKLTPPPGDAAINAEIRAHLSKMEAAARVAFIDSHAVECGAAVLSAPSFLSGLSPAELNTAKQRIEVRMNPEVAEAKAATIKALEQVEAGFRAAIRQISERGGLPKGGNGEAA